MNECPIVNGVWCIEYIQFMTEHRVLVYSIRALMSLTAFFLLLCFPERRRDAYFKVLPEIIVFFLFDALFYISVVLSFGFHESFGFAPLEWNLVVQLLGMLSAITFMPVALMVLMPFLRTAIKAGKIWLDKKE